MPYRKVFSRGAVVLVVVCVLSHWAVSTAVLRRLAETEHPRIKALLGHEDWLDEHGMFATPLRDQFTWSILLIVLAGSKLYTAARLGENDFRADAICALLGVVIGSVLASVSHILTYGPGMVLRWRILVSGTLWSTVGLFAGLLLAGLATLVARQSNAECGVRSAE